jgi:hypothetical protein
VDNIILDALDASELAEILEYFLNDSTFSSNMTSPSFSSPSAAPTGSTIYEQMSHGSSSVSTPVDWPLTRRRSIVLR